MNDKIDELLISKLANEQFDADTKKIPVPASLWYDSQDVQYYSFIKGFQTAQELLSDRETQIIGDIALLGIEIPALVIKWAAKNNIDINITHLIVDISTKTLAVCNRLKSWNIEGRWDGDRFKITKIC